MVLPFAGVLSSSTCSTFQPPHISLSLVVCDPDLLLSTTRTTPARTVAGELVAYLETLYGPLVLASASFHLGFGVRVQPFYAQLLD